MATRGEGNAGTKGAPQQSAAGAGGAAGGAGGASAEQQRQQQQQQQQAAGRSGGGEARGAAGTTETERSIPVSGEAGRAQQRRGGAVRRAGGGLAPARTGGGLAALRGAVPLSPLEMMVRMSEEMDRLLDSIGAPTAMRTGRRGRTNLATPAALGTTAAGTGLATTAAWIPQVEVVQQPNAVVVRVDLSGVNPDEIDVSVEDGVLTISGERREEEEEERQGVVLSERVYGTFYRAIPLPDGADEDQITANFRNGVLEIMVPVSSQERGRRINVQS